MNKVTKKPIGAMTISMTTDGGSPKDADTRNSKGEFEIELKALDSAGNYDIKAKFDGDSQYKSSDSSVKITVEEAKLTTQESAVTSNQHNTNEQQTDEQQTDEQQTDEQQTDEQQTDEQQTDQEEPE
jgi:Ca-activated chloride channel family protein